MSKTSSKTKTALTTTVSVDPRQRMKEVRSFVKAFMKGKFPQYDHLAQYPNNRDDANRVIIALQDTLEKTMRKHREATGYIGQLLQDFENAQEYQVEMITQTTEYISALESKLSEMNMKTSEILKADRSMSEALYEERMKNAKLQDEVDALTLTLKKVLEA